MKLTLKYILMVFLVGIFGCQPTTSPMENQEVEKDSVAPFTIGEIRRLHSETLGEDRVLNIYLPASYSDSTAKNYPVIYLLDGSMDEDIIHISGLVQFGSFSWINMLPESIVVGIANVDRQRDFTYPTTDEESIKMAPTQGGSANFIPFLESELIPFVNSTYRTTSTTTLIGQSLGGLLATEVLLKNPDMFTNYIIVSPSLWWDNESLLNEPIPVLNEGVSVYIGVGKEGEMMERPAKMLYDKVSVANPTNSSIYFQFFENNDHGDVLHLAAYDAFEKIFSSIY